METIWTIFPADRVAYLTCLTEIGPHLDRAGVDFHIADLGETIARAIIEADGKQFVPVGPVEAREEAEKPHANH